MYKIAYRPTKTYPDDFVYCTPSYPSFELAKIAARDLQDRRLKEGHKDEEYVVSKRLSDKSGQIAWSSEIDVIWVNEEDATS